jgi:hypothetical protein
MLSPSPGGSITPSLDDTRFFTSGINPRPSDTNIFKNPWDSATERNTAIPESGPHPQSDHIRAYRKSALHHADLVALFVFNFWDAIGAIGELEDLLWSG